MSNVIWQKAASASCHPWRRQMHSSAACSGQAHLPVAAGEQCTMNSCVDMSQWAGICPLKCVPSRGGCGPSSSIMVPSVHMSQPPNGISICSAVFFLSSPVCPTHRHTDHATCDICSSSRIYALRAGDAASARITAGTGDSAPPPPRLWTPM